MARSIDTSSWEMILQLRDNHGEPLIFSLCQIFLESTPKRLKAIRDGLSQNQPAAVAAETHALKSSSANLGALKFSQLCSGLEGLSKAGALASVGAPIFAQMEAEYAIVVREMKTLLQEAAGEASAKKSVAPSAVPAVVPVAAGPTPAEAPKRVLIVDDDPFYRALLTRTVAQVTVKPTVTTVDSYDKAVALLRQSRPGADSAGFDLIIADLNLKSSSTGIDVWKVAKVRLPDVVFLLISGTPLDEFMAMVEGQTGEAPAYLPKPFRLDQCRNMLEWLFRARDKKAA